MNMIEAALFSKRIKKPVTMFGRNWLCIFALWFLSAGELQSQQIDHSPPEAQPAAEVEGQKVRQDGDQSAGQEQQLLEEALLAIQGVESAIRDLIAEQRVASAQESEERAERYLEAQEGMAWWTAVMSYIAGLSVLVTFVGVMLIKWTLDATRDAARHAEGMLREAKQATKAAQDAVVETRRIGEAQVRAYISLEKPEFSFPDSNSFTGQNAAEVLVFWRNYGSSPANNMSIVGGTIYSPTNTLLTKIPTFESIYNNATIGFASLSPTETKRCRVGAINPSELKEFTEGRGRILIYSVAVFTDVFGKTIKTERCVMAKLLVSAKDDWSIDFTVYPHHNTDD